MGAVLDKRQAKMWEEVSEQGWSYARETESARNIKTNRLNLYNEHLANTF